jgi:murein DD-endopeptidase MepM/ murein hydrolase activator NlpD
MLLTILALTQVATPPNANCGLALPKQAQPGQLIQGRVIDTATDPSLVIEVAGRRLQRSPGQEFVFGIGRDATGKFSVVTKIGAKSCIAEIPITPRKYRTEVVNGVPQSTVTPDPEQQLRIEQESALITAARAIASPRLDWRSAMRWPATGRITGVYGSQRIVNKQPLNPHLGLDIAAPTGTAVYAPLAGKVSLVHDGMLMTGGTLLIDHGFGISTIYIHLSKVHAKLGAEVTAGERIAEIGATGRASGPHLHFQVHWFQEKLDPQLLLPALPKPAAKK